MLRVVKVLAVDMVPLGVWQRLFPKDVIALGYHVVADEALPHIKHYAYKSVRRFEADVAYVSEHQGFVRYDELVRCRLHGARMPANKFLFTFDDGFVQCFEIARPILVKYAASAMFFVPIDFIDNRTMFFETKISLCMAAVEGMSDNQATEIVALVRDVDAKVPNLRYDLPVSTWWSEQLRILPTQDHRTLFLRLVALEEDNSEQIDRMCERLGVDVAGYFQQRRPYMTAKQLCQLVDDGFIVGSHGIAHQRMQLMSPEQMEKEIVTSCDIIRQTTGQKKVSFAFPHSGNGIDRSFLASLSKRYDFIELFFDTGGIRTDAPFIVDRVWADPPAGCVGDETNLPRLLHQEWSRKKAWSTRRSCLPAHGLGGAVE